MSESAMRTTRTVQKWRFSAPQTHLGLIIRQLADSASIRQLADGENRHLRQARNRKF